MTSVAAMDEVAPIDALMFRADGEPATRAVMTGAVILERAPDWPTLVEVFEAATTRVPRLRQKVVTPLLPVGPAEWVTDPDFDIRYHLRRSAVVAGGELTDVLRSASASATANFDRARPLWEATLVEGLADGCAVLLLRAHHALTDGVGAIEILAALLDLDAERAVGPALADAQPPARVTRSGLLARRLAQAQRKVPARNLAMWRAAWTVSLFPARTAACAVASVTSLRRVIDTKGAGPSPLLRSRSRSRQYGAIEVPLAALKAAGKAADGSVNDAYLAALLGAFRRYYEQVGGDPGDVPMALPVNVRGGVEAAAGGNHFGVTVIAGPATIADAQERIQRVRDLIGASRSETAINGLLRLAPVAALLPDAVASRGVAAYAKRVDLQASNVMGAPMPTYLAGVRVLRLFPFGPLPGIPVMAVLLSHDGTCCIGVTLDPAAVRDTKLFLTCLVDGFDEVLDGRAHAVLVAAS
jgi:diacylglycerol O-acyltransferase / wax synthase